MKFALTQKVATFALVAVAVIPLHLSEQIDLIWTFIFVALYGAGWFLEPPLTREPRLRRIVTAIVFTVLAIQIGLLFAGAPMARLGMEFAIAILGLKMCSRGYSADYYQIVILSFLHVIAATIATDDLSYAASFILFVSLSPPVLALTYLRKEMERRFAGDKEKDGPVMLERLLGSKRIISPGFIVGSALLSLPVFFVIAFLFITFPRIGFGLFGKLPKDNATVGFGDEVTLSDLDLIREDNTVLMRMEPIGPFKNRPARLPIKIRGAVFENYETHTWTKGGQDQSRKLKPVGNNYPLYKKYFIKDKTPGFEVLLESMEPPLLFLPEGTGQITTYPEAAGGIPKARSLTRNSLGAIQYTDKAKVGLRYRVYLTGEPPYGPPPNKQHTYLQLPPNSDRLKALTHDLAGEGSTRQQIVGLINGLRNNYRYSAKTKDSDDNVAEDNPLDRFLFSRKTGTCTHFATALTLMLRVKEIPSRVVTGFGHAYWNQIGGYYAVLKSSAHAWTEAYLNGKWVTLDATPGSGQATTKSPFSSISQVLDTIRMRWHKHVVSYDASSQFEIAISLREHILRLRKHSWGISNPYISMRSLGISVGIVLVIGILIQIMRRWPKINLALRIRAFKRNTKEATKLYVTLERRLARRGHPRPISRTPDEHVRVLWTENHSLAKIAEQVTKRYNEVRFGSSTFESNELERLRISIREL